MKSINTGRYIFQKYKLRQKITINVHMMGEYSYCGNGNVRVRFFREKSCHDQRKFSRSWHDLSRNVTDMWLLYDHVRYKSRYKYIIYCIFFSVRNVLFEVVYNAQHVCVIISFSQTIYRKQDYEENGGGYETRYDICRIVYAQHFVDIRCTGSTSTILRKMSPCHIIIFKNIICKYDTFVPPDCHPFCDTGIVRPVC